MRESRTKARETGALKSFAPSTCEWIRSKQLTFADDSISSAITGPRVLSNQLRITSRDSSEQFVIAVARERNQETSSSLLEAKFRD